jgi:SET domain-containing protein
MYIAGQYCCRDLVRGCLFQPTAHHAPRTMPPKRQFLDQRLYVQVSTIPNAGKGLFTLIPIHAGTVIGQYVGEELPLSAMSNKTMDKTYFIETMPYFKWSPMFGSTISVPAAILDGKTMDNKMRWINDPRYDKARINAEMKQDGNGRVFVYSKRLIKPGEEILMSYGRHYWKEEEQAQLNKWLVY